MDDGDFLVPKNKASVAERSSRVASGRASGDYCPDMNQCSGIAGKSMVDRTTYATRADQCLGPSKTGAAVRVVDRAVRRYVIMSASPYFS